MQTPAECRLRLRNALFDDDGKDKDVAKDFEAFLDFKKGDFEAKIVFHTGKKLQKKNSQLLKFFFNTTKEQQEEAYDSSGYGWDDDDKKNELGDRATRFLVEQAAPVHLVH